MRPAILVLLAACAPTTGSQTVDSSLGLYVLDVTFDPDPPTAADGIHTMVTVREADSGAAVEGASIELVPFMPAHGHGIPDDVVVEEHGEGAYDADFTFSMPGTWEVRLELDAEAGTDEAVATVEVL